MGLLRILSPINNPQEVESFIDRNRGDSFEKTKTQVLEVINSRIRWVRNNEEDLVAYLEGKSKTSLGAIR